MEGWPTGVTSRHGVVGAGELEKGPVSLGGQQGKKASEGSSAVTLVLRCPPATGSDLVFKVSYVRHCWERPGVLYRES